MTHSEDLQELFAALSEAQGEGLAALKDTLGQVGTEKRRYADLASCWDAARGPLSKHGLCVVQVPSADGNKITVHTTIGHKSGQYISGELTMTSTVGTAQGLGSAITYARRYSLCAMVGIAPEDDDGTAASQGTKEQAAKVGEEKVKKLKEQTQAAASRAAGEASLGVDVTDLPPAPVPDGPVEFKRMMDGFEAIKAEFTKLGRQDAYYQVLSEYDYKHANEIRPLIKAREIYLQMGRRKRELMEEELSGGLLREESTVG